MEKSASVILASNTVWNKRRICYCISQEQWEIVQEVRQHKKRTAKHTDEPNIFSGLVLCADCGKPLVLHRASTMKKVEYNFKCYTYGKKGKTVHND